MELGVAIQEGQKLGSQIEYIDESPRDLQFMMRHDDTGNVAKTAQSRFQMYPHKYNSSSSLMGEMLYQAVCFWVFRGKPIKHSINCDYAGIGEYSSHLQLWARFHPSTFYWFIGLRDAVMTERIRSVVMNLKRTAPADLDSKTIVVVVGKSHYFGIKQLWDRFVQDEKFKMNT